MDTLLLVVFVVLAAVVVAVVVFGPRVAPPPAKPAPDPVAARKPADGPVTTHTHDLGDGVVVHAIQIDRFAIAPDELPPDEDLPGRDEITSALEVALITQHDGDAPARAIALVGSQGSGRTSIAAAALHGLRHETRGAVMLELGASSRAPMDVEVARSIFVHTFEMEARLSIEQVRARYASLLEQRVALLLRDASRAQLEALVPTKGQAALVVTTSTSLGLSQVKEHSVGALDDAFVRARLAKAGALDASSLTAHVAGHTTALRLAEAGLARDARTYSDAIERASGDGLGRVLSATLATLDPELAAFARALAILPTSFDASIALVIGRAKDADATHAQLETLIEIGIVAPSTADKFDCERAEVRPALRGLLREGVDDLAERALVFEMANRLVEEEARLRSGPTKRAPALYFLGLEWPSFDLARTIALTRVSEHSSFAKGVEIFERGAPMLLAERPAMARAWKRA